MTWDEERGKFSTHFWTIVHRFLFSLRYLDSLPKRSARVISLDTLTESYVSFYSLQGCGNNEISPVAILLRDCGVRKGLRLNKFQKRVCRLIYQGFSIHGKSQESLRGRYGRKKVSRTIRVIRNKAQHLLVGNRSNQVEVRQDY